MHFQTLAFLLWVLVVNEPDIEDTLAELAGLVQDLELCKSWIWNEKADQLENEAFRE